MRLLEEQLEAKSKLYLLESGEKSKLSARVQDLTEKLEEETRKVAAHLDANLSIRKEAREAKEQAVLAKSKARTQLTSGITAGLEKELETMKSKLSCSVCSCKLYPPLNYFFLSSFFLLRPREECCYNKVFPLFLRGMY